MPFVDDEEEKVGEITSRPGGVEGFVKEKLPRYVVPFWEQMQGAKEWRSPETAMEAVSLYAMGKALEPVAAVVKTGAKALPPLTRKLLGMAPKNARELGYHPVLKMKDGSIVKASDPKIQHFDIAEEKGINWENVQEKGFVHLEKPDIFLPKGEVPESVNPIEEKIRLEKMPKPDAVKHVKNLSDEGLQHMADANGIRFQSREQTEKGLVKPLMQAPPQQKFDIEELTKSIPKIHEGQPSWTEQMSKDLRASTKEMQESFEENKNVLADAIRRWSGKPRKMGPPALEMRDGTTITGMFGESTADLIKRKGINVNNVARRGQWVATKPGKSQFLPITGFYGSSDWQMLIRSHVGNLQLAGAKSAQFAKSMIKNVPSDLHREAILNYIEAAGDVNKLSEWYLKSLKNPKTVQYAQGYRAATRLPAPLKKFAEDVRKYFDVKAEVLEEMGLLKDFVDNYVPHIQKNPNSDSARAFRGESNASGNRYVLHRPFFTRERIHQVYFDSEQAGISPVKKDIAHNLVKYDMAFHKAVETRHFIDALREGIASDGKPLVHIAGKYWEVPKDQPVKTATLITLKGAPEEFAHYQRGPDLAAFRDWKWVGEKDGHGVFMQGDMHIHPEIHKKVMALFEPSRVSRNPVLRGIQRFESNVKGVMVSASGFHQVHVGSHAAFHGVNPFNAPKVDWNDKLTQDLARSGLMLHNWEGGSLFHQGLSAGGLMTKIPFFGDWCKRYTDYLFDDYIPRVKLQMAKKALERNMERYGKDMTKKEIMNLTADQANAAFGELNYAVLGRSKTMRDWMQILLFAPDFLEARARFTAQSFRPYGQGPLGFLNNEQFMAAAIRATLGLFGGSRILNALFNNGDPRWDHPFTVKVGKYEVGMRSVPADVWHLLSDPFGFGYVRLSPVVLRPAIELIQARTRSGKSVELDDAIKDIMKGAAPINITPYLKEGGKIWMSALSVFGVNVHESRTAFEQAAILQRSKRSVFTPTKEDAERQKIIRQYSRELKEAKTPEEKREVRDHILGEGRAKGLFAHEYEKIQERSTVEDIEPTIKAMELPDLMKIWGKANEYEKKKYMPILAQKLINFAATHPGEYNQYKEKFGELKKEIKKSKAPSGPGHFED